MNSGYLSQYFEAVAAKTLKAVEVNGTASHQHEFNGTRALKRVIKTGDTAQFDAKFIWMAEENEAVVSESTVSWYDSRKNQPHRSSEYRLYFKSNDVMSLAKEGDTMFIARRTDNTMLIIVTPPYSTIERQLYWLFNLQPVTGYLFSLAEFEKGANQEIDFSARFILEEIGVEIDEPENDILDRLLLKYVDGFPTTVEFSAYARHTVPEKVNIADDPDHALLAFMNWEEKLFRRLERHNVARRIRDGFKDDHNSEDVDGFISYSLSVQNRRKARAGNAFEDHLKHIFDYFQIKYSKGRYTENKSKPDFIFPHLSLYLNPDYPTYLLTMLGVKTSLKDRWRQVLSEASRIELKHLITLEPGISEFQTEEIKAKNIKLIVPREIQQTFSERQRLALLTLKDFITYVLKNQTQTIELAYKIP